MTAKATAPAIRMRLFLTFSLGVAAPRRSSTELTRKPYRFLTLVVLALPTFTGMFTRRRVPRADLAGYGSPGSGIEGGVQSREVGKRGQNEIRSGRAEITIGKRTGRDTDRSCPRLDRGGHVRGRVADIDARPETGEHRRFLRPVHAGVDLVGREADAVQAEP